MTLICKINLIYNPGWSRSHATLNIARIDGYTGNTLVQPHDVAHGDLDIQPLIEQNERIVERYQAATSRHQYFGGSETEDEDIDLPSNMLTNIGSTENTINGLQMQQNIINQLRTDIEALVESIDLAFQDNSLREIRKKLRQALFNIERNESVRIVFCTSDPRIQDLPLENTSFIMDELSRNRSIDIVFSLR